MKAWKRPSKTPSVNFCVIMNRTIVVIVVLIVLGGGYYLFTRSGSNGAPAQTVSPTASPANETVVNIQNFSFSPVTLSVKTGATVTWTNNDSATHTVTSDADGILNSPSLSSGQSFSYTFSTPGTFSYHCAVHPMMKGTIVVAD